MCAACATWACAQNEAGRAASRLGNGERARRAYFLVSLLVSVAPGCGALDEPEVEESVDEPELGEADGAALGAADEAPALESVLVSVAALVSVEALVSDFASVLGEAAGLELAPAALVFESTPSLVIVSASSRPLPFRPSLLWK